MARSCRPDLPPRRVFATGAVRARRTALLLGALALMVLVSLLALLPAEPACAQESQWVLTQTLVNPEKVPLEYYGGGKTPGFFVEERFKDMVMIYKVSATSFSIKDRWQDREYIAWDVTINCNFDAPQKTLVPGKPYKLTAEFSHTGSTTEPHPGEAFTYYIPDFSLDPNESLTYYPSNPGSPSKTWSFTAPAASPGATMEIQAGLWNAPACTVIWKYEARAAAPEYGVIEIDGVIHLVSPPGGVLRISRADLPEWARDAVATVGDEVACVGPPATLTQGDPAVLLDGKPVARVGDGTSHGGTVVSGDSLILVNGVPAATVGDYATCPMITGLVPHVGGPIIGRPGTATTSTSTSGQSATGQPQPSAFTEAEFEKMKTSVAAQATSALGPTIGELMKQGYIGMVIAATGDCALYDYTGERMRDPAGRRIHSETGSYQLVRIGDTLQTGSNGLMRIELFDWDGNPRHHPSVVNMATNTMFVFDWFGQDRRSSTLISLLRGALRTISRGWVEPNLTIKAGVTLCYVKGSDILVSYDPENDVVVPPGQEGPVEYLGAWVLEGHMDVTDSSTGRTVALTDRQSTVAIDGAIGPVGSFTEAKWDEWVQSLGVEDMQPLSTEEWEALVYGETATTAPTTSQGATTTSQPPVFTQEEFLAMQADVAAQAPNAPSDEIGRWMKHGYIGLVTTLAGEWEIFEYTGEPMSGHTQRIVYSPGRTWQLLRIGDTVQTAADGTVRIDLFDWDGSSPGGTSIINMGPNTTLVFTEFDGTSKERTWLSLIRGGMRVLFQGSSRDSSLNVRAGVGLCGVRGSDVLVFYTPATDRVEAYVGEGRMDVGSSKTGQATFLTENQRLVVDGGNLGGVEPLSREEWQALVEGNGLTDMTPLTLKQLKDLGKSGLSARAWIAVGVGIAAFLAAMVLGLYLLRRRRKRGGGEAAPSAGMAASADTPGPSPGFCGECGSALGPGATFCGGCGKKL